MNIYDFDKTIYDGDSSIDFFKYSLRRNKAIIWDLFPIGISFCLYLIKIKEKEYFKSSFFRFLKRIEVDSYVKDFWQKNDEKIKAFYQKSHKDNDIVISASPEFLLKPMAKKYKFKLIATKMDKKTGQIVGKNCYGVEKINRLKAEQITKINNFYTDSLSDTPCLEIAQKGFIVKNNELIPWQDYHEKNSLLKIFLNRDFITFLFIGGINVFNGVWIAFVYSLFIKNAILAYILGFLTSLCIAYLLNSLLNFKAKLSIKKFITFVISNIPNFIIQVLSVFLFIQILAYPKIIAYMISAVVAVPITFILVKLNVFNNK